MANQKRYESVQGSVDIVFRAVSLTVEFTFHPGWDATEFEPPEYDWVEVDRVLLDEVNIYSLIGEQTFTDLVEAVEKEVDKMKDKI